MTARKYLEGLIRGWLPKEANMPSLQQTTAYRFFPTHKALVAFVILVLGAGFVGGLLGALGFFLGISSKLGVFWSMIIGMVMGTVVAGVYGRIHRKEGQKRAKI
jgi:VIT1/CCC1 family predicted Fe2+/Mn2+ transporter